jgi:hypothetical protein
MLDTGYWILDDKRVVTLSLQHPASGIKHRFVLVPIYSNPIMLAYHLCDRQIKITERHAAQAPALRERFHKSTIIPEKSGSPLRSVNHQ